MKTIDQENYERSNGSARVGAFIHSPTWTCDFWRPCCCHRGVQENHCWGCGMAKNTHADGEGFTWEGWDKDKRGTK